MQQTTIIIDKVVRFSWYSVPCSLVKLTFSYGKKESLWVIGEGGNNISEDLVTTYKEICDIARTGKKFTKNYGCLVNMTENKAQTIKGTVLIEVFSNFIRGMVDEAKNKNKWLSEETIKESVFSCKISEGLNDTVCTELFINSGKGFKKLSYFNYRVEDIIREYNKLDSGTANDDEFWIYGCSQTSLCLWYIIHALNDAGVEPSTIKVGGAYDEPILAAYYR